MKRIGFCTFFAWRPHVQHMHYVASLARSGGHEVRFLTCDGDLPACYSRELHASVPAWLECTKCRVGGLRSYESAAITNVGSLSPSTSAVLRNDFALLAESSAATLVRMEAEDDMRSDASKAAIGRLAPAVARAYDATRRWIERERLDAVFVFNGRMDATRGAYEAARDLGVRVVSLERTWFGDGIQLLPDEICLGLRSVGSMVRDWANRPLTGTQAQRAARLAASRFLRRNLSEWRAYNLNAVDEPWPSVGGKHRILLLPSSRNEQRGFEVDGYWPDRSAAFDLLIERLKLAPSDLILRAHPNWSERIGPASGHLSERYYADWARKRGVTYIPSHAGASTMALIAQADAVVLNGGSAALEAGILGKQVIALAPSIYSTAGFETRFYDESDAAGLSLRCTAAGSSDEVHAVSRQALRFVYSMAYRVAQFVPYVRLKTTTDYEYFAGGDARRLDVMIDQGRLPADDDRSATGQHEESETLSAIARRDWVELFEWREAAALRRISLPRRPEYRLLDALRERWPKGDMQG